MDISRKKIIELAENLQAKDITYLSFEELNKLIKDEQAFDYVASSCGTYGVNAKIVRGYNTKTFYVITSRTSAVFML